MSNIGNNIKARRTALKMTQEELAAKMGYKSKSTINKIELGINDIPQSKIVKFAEVLQTTPKVLMGWEEVTEEMEKNNDIMSDVIVRMRTDEEFFKVVETLNSLGKEQLAKLNIKSKQTGRAYPLPFLLKKNEKILKNLLIYRTMCGNI